MRALSIFSSGPQEDGLSDARVTQSTRCSRRLSRQGVSVNEH